MNRENASSSFFTQLKLQAVTVTIVVVCCLALIIGTAIVAGAITGARNTAKVITVTGSAKKQIASDLVTWTALYSFQSSGLQNAYTRMTTSAEKVKQYFLLKGIPEKNMVFSAVDTRINYTLLENGTATNTIESYTLSQRVTISSNEVEKITLLSRESTELIREGITFSSREPQYYYTKIAELKIDMIGLATKDARDRAEQIAEATTARIGPLKSARMGVFQITPLYSTMVDDSGAYDTSTVEKEITAVISCEFEIR